MRRFIFICFATAICAMLTTSGAAWAQANASNKPLSESDAKHLLLRAGFGLTAKDIASTTGLTRGAAFDGLLQRLQGTSARNQPEGLAGPLDSYENLEAKSPEARQEWNRRQMAMVQQMRVWWLNEMQYGAPLREKMVLFWHNHFATSQQKVRPAQLMWRQHELLRSEALGSFAQLLPKMAQNPAMLIYLDGAQNRKGNPNENFAREVMELFTLGQGNYSENDIKELARALTGWSVDRETGEFLMRAGQHDKGSKTILGETGPFSGQQAIEILLRQPRTSQFIVEKLWREFVSPELNAPEITRLAKLFKEGGYEITSLLRAMLTADSFYDPKVRGTLVKSPIELTLGLVRNFNVDVPTLAPAVAASTLLGQALFAPPNVKGWPGGNAWITSSTLLGRKAFAERLFRGAEMRNEMIERTNDLLDEPTMERRERRLKRQLERGIETWLFEQNSWTQSLGATERTRSNRATRLLLALPPTVEPSADLSPLELVRSIVLDPVYQLK